MTKTIPTSAPLLWADRLRNWATVLVIIIHLSAPIAHQFPDFDTWQWWAGNWWDALGRPAVNLFVMLSGFLLLSKDYPTIPFLQKRLTRVLIPALFWMGIYLIYGHLAKNDPPSLGQALLKIVQGPVHYHLWFIYLILGLYLMYPVLRPWVRQAREQDFWYFFVVCMLGTWFMKLFYVFFGVKIGLHFELFTNQVGHFVLGYYLGHKVLAGETTEAPGIAPWRWSKRGVLLLGWGLAIGGTVATALGGYWHGKAAGVFQTYFYDYLTPNVTLAAAGWLLVARHSWNRRPLLEIEQEFSAASFGIYLAHVLVLDWWSQCGYWHSVTYAAKAIPILVSMVTLTTFSAVLLIRALPGGKKIT
ncbi:MAG: acyltransferase family protein [Saprospiraceae bacterium]|nr:acyltransferase family protein [Saprospiraceae bacterium]